MCCNTTYAHWNVVIVEIICRNNDANFDVFWRFFLKGTCMVRERGRFSDERGGFERKKKCQAWNHRFWTYFDFVSNLGWKIRFWFKLWEKDAWTFLKQVRQDMKLKIMFSGLEPWTQFMGALMGETRMYYLLLTLSEEENKEKKRDYLITWMNSVHESFVRWISEQHQTFPLHKSVGWLYRILCGIINISFVQCQMHGDFH